MLTVLQNRLVTPLGSNEAIPVNIRLICATNLSLTQLADESKFRKDLIYRINTVDFTIPPLRERSSDITLLAHHFVEVYAEKYLKQPFKLAPDFLRKLKEHSFPGNVRELQYALERAVIMAEGDVLYAEDLAFSQLEKLPETELKLKTTNLDAVEKNTILKVIEKNKGK